MESNVITPVLRLRLIVLCAPQVEFSTLSPMGGSRHKGIGMNKKKRQKVVPVQTRPMDLVNDGDDEDSDDDDQLHSPAPAPAPAPPASLAACSSDALPGSNADEVQETFGAAGRRLHTEMLEAEKECEKVQRRWDRKLSWVMGGGNDWDGPHSLWRPKSEVKRDEQRLAKIDFELADVRRLHSVCRTRWLRWRTYDRVCDRCAANPGDAGLSALFELTRARYLETPPCPHVLDMWPGRHRNIYEVNARQFGLAITYGLAYDHPGGSEQERKEQEQQRRAEKARAAAKVKFEAPARADWASTEVRIKELLDIGHQLKAATDVAVAEAFAEHILAESASAAGGSE